MAVPFHESLIIHKEFGSSSLNLLFKFNFDLVS